MTAPARIQNVLAAAALASALALGPTTQARADAVEMGDTRYPGADCTWGHGGGCVAAPCASDDDCHWGTRCYEWRVCTQGFDVPVWGDAPEGAVDRREWMVASCPRAERCSVRAAEPAYAGSTPTGPVTCRDGWFCAATDRVPSNTPHRGCACGAATPRARSGPALAGVLAVLGGTVVRRRRSG